MTSTGNIRVQVLDTKPSGQIGWNSTVTEELRVRAADLRDAIQAGAQTVADALPVGITVEGWSMSEVSAKFGITLTAEAGVIITKASTAATVEVEVKFERDPRRR